MEDEIRYLNPDDEVDSNNETKALDPEFVRIYFDK